jgi:cysteine desulfurase / selenocysteine lyase
MMVLTSLKKMLPGIGNHVFLNHAATSPLLKPSATHMESFVRQGMEPLALHRESWIAEIEQARSRVAKLIHATANEITFTTNTSAALSLIAESIQWETHDKVLYPDNEFPSNRYVWQNLKQKGVIAESFRLGEDLMETLGTLRLDKVRLIAISAVSYIDGRSHDIAALSRFCHQRGILLAVDAIQAVGAAPVNVSDWNCDFLACGGQKWLLGPVGSGFLYINKRLLSSLFVPTVGWASIKNAGDFSITDVNFCEGARRFEGGLPDIVAVAGMSKSIETLAGFEWNTIFSIIKHHKMTLFDNTLSLGYPVISRATDESGIFSLKTTLDEKEWIQAACEKQRILVSFHQDVLRISPHASSDPSEVGQIISILQQAKRLSHPVISLARHSTQADESSASSPPSRKTALITGASQGLGKCIAIVLAKKGFALHLIARHEETLNSTALALEKNYGVPVTTSAIDLSDLCALDHWIKTQMPACDVLINNAATSDAQLFTEMSPEQVHETFHVNFFSPLRLIHATLPSMIQNKSGMILNIVTSGARCALPMFSSYAASKGALWSLSESLSREMHDSGITVTTFLPPHMPTSTAQRLGRIALSYYRPKASSPSKSSSMMKIAEQAVESMFNHKKSVVPWRTRFTLAMNALLPEMITRKLIG